MIMMYIDVYADTIDGEVRDDNITTIHVSRDVVYQWFIENCLDDFRGDDSDISEEGLFEEWLDEYTCDDTDTLVEYLESHGEKFSELVPMPGIEMLEGYYKKGE